MKVQWLLPPTLAKDAGDRRRIEQHLAVEHVTLGDALEALGRVYPKLLERITDDRGVLREHVNVFVRGQMVRTGLGLRTPLEPGDEIVVLHAVSGG